MSGVTDLPFRRLAARFGAGMVVSEMIASETFVKGDAEFILQAYYPGPDQSAENERVTQIAAACGWQLHTAPQLEKMCPPTPEELKLLRSFDPDCVFLR